MKYLGAEEILEQIKKTTIMEIFTKYLELKSAIILVGS